MKYFWVNQKQTFKQEWEGGFLWAPKRNQKGRTFWHWDSMKRVEAGDIVFCYVDKAIRAYGIVSERAITSSKPNSMQNSPWETEGRLIKLKYHKLSSPIFIQSKLNEIGNFFPNEYSPYSVLHQRGNQIYLANIGEKLGRKLADFSNIKGVSQVSDKITRPSETVVLSDVSPIDSEVPSADSIAVNDLSPSEKQSIVKQRLVQGEFRKALLAKFKGKCALTGLPQTELLIASHIKAWSLSDESERRDVNNGLLLAVHIDALFDKHLISFFNDGKISISRTLDRNTCRIFNIHDRMQLEQRPNSETQFFLNIHRSNLKK